MRELQVEESDLGHADTNCMLFFWPYLMTKVLRVREITTFYEFALKTTHNIL